MNGLFMFLFLLSIVGLIVGLIKPALFNKLFKGNANRKNTSVAFGAAIVLFFILTGVTSPKSNTASQQANIQPQQQTSAVTQNAAIPTSSPAAAIAIPPTAPPKTIKAAPNIPANPQPKQPAATTPAPVATPQPTQAPQTDNQNTSPTSNETVSQQNAVAKAKDYLNYTAFSHDGLVAQLEYDQFSPADATYGADNSGANWDAEAAAKAKDYMSYSAFSRGGLIAQLEYDKFTQEQAEYGANAVGLQ